MPSIRRTVGALALAVVVTGLSACGDVIGSGDATIIVQNNASASVRELYISECDDESWGGDELGTEETIAPGADREFDVEAGCYDLLAIFIDDTEAEDFAIELDEGDEFTWELID